MAAVVNTFLYSGTLRQVVIPAGTQSIDVHLWGGAGGGGGSDAGGPGGTGAAGHHVSATTISMTSNIGKTLTCLLYTSPSPRDLSTSRMPSSA